MYVYIVHEHVHVSVVEYFEGTSWQVMRELCGANRPKLIRRVLHLYELILHHLMSVIRDDVITCVGRWNHLVSRCFWSRNIGQAPITSSYSRWCKYYKPLEPFGRAPVTVILDDITGIGHMVLSRAPITSPEIDYSIWHNHICVGLWEHLHMYMCSFTFFMVAFHMSFP